MPPGDKETSVLRISSRLVRRTPFFYGWVVLLAAATSQFARNAAASLTLAVFIYPMSQQLGWSRTLIAGAASVGGLAAAGASPPVGWLVDRYGARVVLAVSVLVLGFSTISLAWATAPIAFYLAYGAGRVIFSSTVQIGSSVVVSHWFVRRRGRASGLLFLAHAAGMALFPLMASLIMRGQGWRDAWIYLGVLVWLVALGPTSLLIVQRPEDVGLKPDGEDTAGPSSSVRPTAIKEEPALSLREAARTRTLWLLAVAGGLAFMVHAGVNIHLVAHLRDQGLSATVAASAISLNAVFTGVGSIVWGWATERVPVRYAYAGVALVMAVASGLFVTADTTGEAFALASLFGFALGGLLAVPPVAFADYFGRSSLGVIRGVTEPFATVGQSVGAVLSGAIYDSTKSYRGAFFVLAAVATVAMLILLLARPPARASVSAPPESREPG